jgi:hypothetical protein
VVAQKVGNIDIGFRTLEDSTSGSLLSISELL